MPTATEFDLAARILDAVAEDLSDLTASVEGVLADGVVVGGLLTASVEGLAADDADDGLAAAADSSSLARVCEARAEVCRAYEGELASHRREVAEWRSEHERWRRHRDAFSLGTTTQPPGREPRYPRPPDAPPAWVDL